jgi:hypothetical protein
MTQEGIMASSPTSRTLKWLKDSGWTVAITERWCPFSKRRKDLFNFIDILAVRNDCTIGVQCTSGSNVAARKTKILGLDEAKLWVSGGSRKIWVVGWRKLKKTNRWEPRVDEVLVGDFD